VLLAQQDQKSADDKISDANPRPGAALCRVDEKDSALDEIEPGALRLAGYCTYPKPGADQRFHAGDRASLDEDTRPKTETRPHPTRKSTGNQIED
jgi:hypothetical protein